MIYLTREDMRSIDKRPDNSVEDFIAGLYGYDQTPVSPLEEGFIVKFVDKKGLGMTKKIIGAIGANNFRLFVRATIISKLTGLDPDYTDMFNNLDMFIQTRKIALRNKKIERASELRKKILNAKLETYSEHFDHEHHAGDNGDLSAIDPTAISKIDEIILDYRRRPEADRLSYRVILDTRKKVETALWDYTLELQSAKRSATKLSAGTI